MANFKDVDDELVEQVNFEVFAEDEEDEPVFFDFDDFDLEVDLLDDEEDNGYVFDEEDLFDESLFDDDIEDELTFEEDFSDEDCDCEFDEEIYLDEDFD